MSRSLDARVLVRADNATEALQADIDTALASDPTARISRRDDFIDDQAGQINNLLTLLYALLGMSVVVASSDRGGQCQVVSRGVEVVH